MDTILKKLGIEKKVVGGFNGRWLANGKPSKAFSPINGQELAEVVNISKDDYENIISPCFNAFHEWKKVPAPIRGELVRQLGDELRKNKELLGELVTIEMGKSIQEGYGEVQEMIDICDFATGMSRQLCGITMQSERREHRMFEQWHPLGVVGVITAFNFPVAVWAWNTALALICGNTCLWKPSSQTPLTAIACIKIAQKVLERNRYPAEICSLVIGKGSEIGDLLNKDPRIACISYTGSVKGGRHVGMLVQERFGKAILELGGNNAVIVSEKGDMDMALRCVYFGAIGTAGQRCTSTRRVIINENVYDEFISKLRKLYSKTTIGDPRLQKNLMGPLINNSAIDTMLNSIKLVKEQGGKILCGGEKLNIDGGYYISPCIAEIDNSKPIVKEETFAPLLYVMKYKTITEAIKINNDVPQGLSSAIITNDVMESELFLSNLGSDCGIANINIGTSGAEIGGAFGGEKETGGGRESGSDAWKAYMRRQTNTVNYSGTIQLAQGIKFEID